jgi:hypothetical protein
MRVWMPAALVLVLAVASTALAWPTARAYGYGYGYAPPCLPASCAGPCAYPVVPGYGWQPPITYGVPTFPAPYWYGYDAGYVYRLQPGFQFYEPEGRRGFSIRGFTLPGGRR